VCDSVLLSTLEYFFVVLFGGLGGLRQERFVWCSANSVMDRGHGERGFGGGSHIVWISIHFTNE
jgi:hypothetical protein